MPLKLFLDDLRDRPDNSWMVPFRPNGPGELSMFFHLAKHAEAISFDHDLGDDFGGFPDVRNGYDILCILEKQTHQGRIWSTGAPELTVHSANPAGKQKMEQAIESIYKKVGKKSEKG